MTVLADRRVVEGLPAEAYHADLDSLSASGAKAILPPSCPAIFRHQQLHGRPTKEAYDHGHIAHGLVLGEGPEVVEVDAKDWRTKAAQQAAADARERGAVPVLADDYAEIRAMAEALKAHPIAARLFEPGSGRPEMSMYWTDPETGVTLRSRPDWLPHPQPGRRLIIPDYKTADSANPDVFSRAAMNFGYHQQHAFYGAAVEACDLAVDGWAFVFVVQEKRRPYLVSVIELDSDAVRIGQMLNREAIGIFAECSASGVWPAYSDDVEVVSLPYYYTRQFERLA